MPIGFTSATGAFDVPLDISALALGAHHLTITATDAAGNIATTGIDLSLPSALPLTISDTLPEHDASGVSVTFHPKITFSRPVDPATLTNGSVHATSSGVDLPITVVPATDGMSAMLFFQSDMPGGSSIDVSLDGSAIHALDGTPLDANGDGIAGETFHLKYSTLSTTGVLGTTIAGIIADPGPDLIPHSFDDVRAGPDGIINTADDVYLHPLVHAEVYIIGQESQAVFTDAQGRFELDSVPTGDVKIVIDGRTATNAPAGVFFPEMVMDQTILPGIQNTITKDMPEFYLPRVPTDAMLHRR